VVPQESFCVHRGQIELVQTETYWFHKPHDAPSGLGPTPFHLLINLFLGLLSQLLYKANIYQATTSEHIPRVLQRESFLKEEEPSGDVLYRRAIRLSLPGDAPLSIEGNTPSNPARSRGDCSPQITWHVRASLYFQQVRRGWIWRRRYYSDPMILRQRTREVIVVAPPE